MFNKGKESRQNTKDRVLNKIMGGEKNKDKNGNKNENKRKQNKNIHTHTQTVRRKKQLKE